MTEAPDAARISRVIGFLMKLARALHTYGMPSHRLEVALKQISERMGVESQFVVTPTSITGSVGPTEAAQTTLVRLEPGRVNLEKQSELHHLIGDVCARRLTLEQGKESLDSLIGRPPIHGPLATVAAFGLASAAAAVFFDGGRAEAATAAVIGLLIGLLVQAAARAPRFGMVMPGAAGVAAVLITALMQKLLGPMVGFIPTLAGLIILIPGLGLTIAVNELAHGHLVSGTARLGGAMMTFLQIGFGVALGTKLAAWLRGAGLERPDSVPIWVLPIALVVAALAMTVLFRARSKDLPFVLLAATVSFTTSRLGTLAFGPELGVLLGAWLLGMLGHLLGRWRNEPSALAILPGMLLLVPGGLGFTSLSSLLANDIVSGIQAGFTMLLIALSLVTGLMLASITSRSWERF
ncbi:MAG: threonine/serine exporter ThrE family protein [Thermoanaerobaculia bacterium]